MLISLSHAVLLVVAGVLAGVMGTAGGITSLISYPALLAVGIAPLPANVTNVVALVGSFPGAAIGSRPELRGQGSWLRRWALLVAIGGALGVALLLLTPNGLFNHLVPFLLLAAALTLLCQPRISRWHARAKHDNELLLAIGLFSMALYSGYFGAGAGIMVLALLLVTVDEDYPRANALKNMILGVATIVAAAALLIFGPVHLAAAVALGLGLLIGSAFGPVVARNVSSDVLRIVAAVLGIGLAIALFIMPNA
ncbi:MAG TPA: sulfite exporter TauE/SafE family protein [Acidimicrobiales bacterium]|nr:sulfite exporter TauE/SafE family protein [Acidimicrobiales bacterium]